MRRIRWPLALGGIAVIASLSIYFMQSDSTTGERARTVTSTQFDSNKPLLATIEKAERLTLYEGLPHQDAEAGAVLWERMKYRTIQLHGYRFYRTPQDIAIDDVKPLKDLVLSEKTFIAWRGEKKCGGFHPDYLLEWQAGAATYRLLLCFGCWEVKIYGPEQSLRCDIENGSRDQLTELLKKYHKH